MMHSLFASPVEAPAQRGVVYSHQWRLDRFIVFVIDIDNGG
jgi:hypothetical protein